MRTNENDYVRKRNKKILIFILNFFQLSPEGLFVTVDVIQNLEGTINNLRQKIETYSSQQKMCKEQNDVSLEAIDVV